MPLSSMKRGLKEIDVESFDNPNYWKLNEKRIERRIARSSGKRKRPTNSMKRGLKVAVMQKCPEFFKKWLTQ